MNFNQPGVGILCGKKKNEPNDIWSLIDSELAVS